MIEIDRIDVLIIGCSPLSSSGLRAVLDEAGYSVQITRDKLTRFVEASLAMATPRLIIFDNRDVGADFAVCATIRERFPTARLVMLTDDCDLEEVARGLEAGLDAFIERASACETLVNAVRLVMTGEKFMPANAYRRLSNLRSNRAGAVWDAGRDGSGLSDREIDILTLVARGESNKLIGWHLDITEATVKVHIKSILRKLNMRNRTQAAIWAIARGLGTPGPQNGSGSLPVSARG